MTPEGGVSAESAPGVRRGAFYVEKCDGLSVGRECGRVDVAMEFGEASSGAAIETRDKKIGRLARIGAVGEECDRGRVGR